MTTEKSKKDLARRVTINDMKILELGFDKITGEADYRPLARSGRGIYPDFPILIQSNGVPWTLGNIYLVRRMEHTRNYEPKTWQNISIDLLHYLRWLESTETNPLFFSVKQKFNRPTYKYRNFLIEQLNAGVIKKSTAAGRMSSIVNFYRGLVAYGVISNDIIDVAWEEKEVLIRIIGRDLKPRNYSISSTDLAIKTPPPCAAPDYIRDGGQLRPLSDDEQRVIAEHLKSASASYRLMFAVAILTGARMQTICTLRGESLDNAIFNKENNRYLLNVGGQGQLVDTKGSKRLCIVFPAKLFEMLLHHWNSIEAKTRRLISFYGDRKENYLFLNKGGEPYLTSKTEKLDRRDPNINRRVGLEGGVARDVSTRNGQAIWVFINKVLLPKIRKSYPEFKSFSFHDLRATFGMNLLETLLRALDAQNAQLKTQGKDLTIGTEWVLEQVQERLGHSDLATTMNYLNFRRNNQFRAALQTKIEDELMKYVPQDVLRYE